MDAETALIWDQVRERAGQYPPQAYAFVQHGLRHTVEQLFDLDFEDDEFAFDAELDSSRHVSGRDLCMGLRDYALAQFGPLASVVLNHWGIRRTDDFGRIVFNLVDAGLMSKTDDDTIEDFQGVFDFGEAFGQPAELC